jgi:hypothetical protein
MGIGITFIPSAQGQSQTSPAGPQNANNSDLAQAYKILSLRLPQILGTQAISPLAGSPGSNTDALKAYNPYAAVFSALLQSIGGGLGGGAPIDTTGLGGQGSTAAIAPSGRPPDPSMTFKMPAMGARPGPSMFPSSPSDPGSVDPFGGGDRGRGIGY